MKFGNTSSVGQYFAGTCRGIIQNLFNFVPKEVMAKKNFIVATGNALVHNQLMLEYVAVLSNGKEVLPLKSEADAAFGATLVLR